MKKSDKTNDIQIGGRFEWIFNNEELRIVVLKGKEYFYSKDVGKLLGIADKTRKNHVTNMKNNKKLKITNEMLSNSESLSKGLQNIKLNNAGEYFITESGLFELILKSRKPEALEFQEWLVEDVLPSLRKNNYYIDKENIDNTQLDKLKEEIKELKNKLSLYDNKDYYSIFDIRKMLNATSKEFECKSFTLAKTSEEMHIPARHELGEYNNEPCYYKKYHFLIWCSVYPDWFSIDSEHGSRIKRVYEKFKDII